jgi:hypothetical protein
MSAFALSFPSLPVGPNPHFYSTLVSHTLVAVLPTERPLLQVLLPLPENFSYSRVEPLVFTFPRLIPRENYLPQAIHQ